MERSSPPQLPSPPLLLTWLGPHAAPAQAQQAEAVLEARPQSSSLQLAVLPTLGWQNSLHGQVRNQSRELILEEITCRGETQVFVSGMKFLVQCVADTDVPAWCISWAPAVEAAGSVTWFQLCCYPASNHYPSITRFAKC